MNQTASFQEGRRELPGVVQNKRFSKEGGWKKKLLAKEKKGLFYERLFSLMGNGSKSLLRELPHLPLGAGEGPSDRLMLNRKFLTDQLK